MTNKERNGGLLPPTGPLEGGDRTCSVTAVRRWAGYRKRVVGAAAALLAATALVYWGIQWRRASGAPGLPPAVAVRSGAGAGFNVVLITLDTLRADYVGCYGATQVETAALDSLAREGVRFEEAVTTVPLTLPAHATILTGNYPARHGVRNNGTFRLPPGATTLAERLRAAGYRTAAFVASFVLDARFGMDQGFEVYRGVSKEGQDEGADAAERPGDEVTDEALSWLGSGAGPSGERPFFLWLHLYDAHGPHDAPEPFRSRYLANRYAAEVAFVDHQVGRLMARLRDTGRLKRTLVVAVADHGEGLDEHGENNHGLLLYEPTVRVPLILHAPEILARGLVVRDRVVSVADVAPTILDLQGLPLEACDGVSLLRPARSDRAVYLETLLPRLQRGWSELRGLRRRQDKFIEAPTPEYYDLAADRREERNLFEGAEAAGSLRRQLEELVKKSPGEGVVPEASVRLDEETARKLAALGYVGGTAPRAAGPPADPKEVVAHWSKTLSLAQEARREGRFSDAIDLMRGFLSEFPADSDTWWLLALWQEEAGRVEEASNSWLRAVELQPGNAEVWARLAKNQYYRKDLEGMQLSLGRAERIDPHNGAVLLMRAVLAQEGGRAAEALALCRQARVKDPARFGVTSWYMEAGVLESEGRREEAMGVFRQILARVPGDPVAAKALARLARRGPHPGEGKRRQ